MPKFLAQEATDYRIRDQKHERAYEIICKWADLEASGTLRRRKESNIESEFLVEVFGEALGYTLYSEGLDRWNLDFKFNLPVGTADAALGVFSKTGRKLRALIELKGPGIDLDRDRSQGRTPVQQCWDYLNEAPECPWGIVSNIVSFRLYRREMGSACCQVFTLQELRTPETFREFYYLFEKGGLLPTLPGQTPRADALLEKTAQRQREVGDELYDSYHGSRVSLVQHLCGPDHNKPLDKAIYITQRLLDRIVFVAFCEDRGLLPPKTIAKAYNNLPPFYRVTNPRWQNFLNLFHVVDEGDPAHHISRFNGGLFRADSEVDDLQLEDEWTNIFKDIGSYDFRDEVNVDVLGHLFERSINDLERLRLGGFFQTSQEKTGPKMLKSAERKKLGTYYTPPEFTKFIVYNTVGKLLSERFEAQIGRSGLTAEDLAADKPDPKHAAYWRACLDILKAFKVVDPACGSGAFLIQAFDLLEDTYRHVIDHIVFHEGVNAEGLREDVPDFILRDNLFGVDLAPEAVEISQLALWIRSARTGRTLADLSTNIVCGNSLVADKAVNPRALDWRETFPEVFARAEGGFDGVIGNPPWERMKLQEREFFDALAPDIAASVSAATRREKIAQLEKLQPNLHRRYLEAKAGAENVLDYVRSCGRFPMTGKGDVNTYAVFAELARTLVAPAGAVGLLVPSGIATDHTTKEFFGELSASNALFGLYDFENKAPVFPDVHRSFKFSVLLFGGADRKTESADFFFFARTMEDLDDKSRHIALTAQDMKLFNPNTRTCPIFRTRRDADLTKAIYRRVPVLVDENRKEGGNPWGVRFFTMFHQTNDAGLFQTAEDLAADKAKREGPIWKKGKKRYLPLYEAKMVQAYDHRAASVVVKPDNWMRQGQTAETSLVEHLNPEFSIEPRWWVEEEKVKEALGGSDFPGFIGFKDITSPTNQRTIIAAGIPWAAVTNHFPLVVTSQETNLNLCLLANLNAFPLDYVTRQKIGGVTLNFFIVEQLPIFPPDFYSGKCPWARRQTLQAWIADRVLKLTCTSNDMIPLAQAAGFDPPVHKWKPDERADLQAQLDAAFFLLYGLDRSDVEYILSTFSASGDQGGPLVGAGTALTRILEHYDRLREASGG